MEAKIRDVLRPQRWIHICVLRAFASAYLIRDSLYLLTNTCYLGS